MLMMIAPLPQRGREVAALTHPTAACPLLAGEWIMVIDDEADGGGGAVSILVCEQSLPVANFL